MKITSLEIKCEHCGKLFPSRMFHFDELRFLQSTSMAGNTETCPHCGKQASNGKEHMVVNGTPYSQLSPI